MSTLLSFESPLEFLLRYTVIAGVFVAIIGVAIIFMAKRLTMTIRKQEVFDKSDRLYIALFTTGIILLLVGMIIMVLPISDTLYHA